MGEIMKYAVKIIIIIALLLSPTYSYANCEAAPYGFHTIAKYGWTTETGGWLIGYIRYDKGMLLEALSGAGNYHHIKNIYTKLINDLNIPFEIKIRDNTLVIQPEDKKQIIFETHLRDEITIPNTIIDTTTIPTEGYGYSKGYGNYESETHTLWLSDNLKFEKGREPQNIKKNT
jgi:hypothetical protein